MNCCGQNRTTAFCPDCGKLLDNPLAELLIHVETIAESKRREEETRKARWAENPDPSPSEKRRRHGLRREAAAEKWARWAKALREVVEGQAK